MGDIRILAVQVLITVLFVGVASQFGTEFVSRAAECSQCSDDTLTKSQEPNHNQRGNETLSEETLMFTNWILQEINSTFDMFNAFAGTLGKSGFTLWSKWNRCSIKGHTQQRFRSCILGRIGGLYCSGANIGIRPCCPHGYLDLRPLGFKSCIKYHHHSTNHTDAEERCARSNGHLIEITNLEKKDVVQNYVEQIPNLITYQYFHVDGELVNGTWVNRNGVPLDYIPWGDEPYLKPGWVYLGLHPEDFLMYDIQSDYRRQYVCEIDL